MGRARNHLGIQPLTRLWRRGGASCAALTPTCLRSPAALIAECDQLAGRKARSRTRLIDMGGNPVADARPPVPHPSGVICVATAVRRPASEAYVSWPAPHPHRPRRYCLLVIRYRVLVSGQVQGVYFRDTCRRMALKHGVSGWVRNLPNGQVEAVFEGPDEDVHRLVDWTRHGPGWAGVAGVAVQAEQPEGLAMFQIR